MDVLTTPQAFFCSEVSFLEFSELVDFTGFRLNPDQIELMLEVKNNDTILVHHGRAMGFTSIMIAYARFLERNGSNVLFVTPYRNLRHHELHRNRDNFDRRNRRGDGLRLITPRELSRFSVGHSSVIIFDGVNVNDIAYHELYIGHKAIKVIVGTYDERDKLNEHRYHPFLDINRKKTSLRLGTNFEPNIRIEPLVDTRYNSLSGRHRFY